MSDEKKLILFDIDHTLFDSSLYLQHCFFALGQKLNILDSNTFVFHATSVYKIHRKTGSFRPRQFLEELLGQTYNIDKKLESVFSDPSVMNQSLYPDVEETLHILSERGYNLGIFSYGTDSLQRLKIHSLAKYFMEEHTNITQLDKVESVSELFKKYQNNNLLVVDDLPQVLKACKEINKQVTTVLIDRESKFSEYQKSELDNIDYTLANLREMLTIIL